MSKIRLQAGEDRLVPIGFSRRLVLDGQTIDVPDDEVYGYTQQSIWVPVDDEAQKAHDDGEAAYQLRLNPPDETAVAPAKNASTEVWAAYAVASGQATPADVAGLSRDDLIQHYGPQEG